MNKKMTDGKTSQINLTLTEVERAYVEAILARELQNSTTACNVFLRLRETRSN